ncbi:hypothetical protein [Brunnivagina elsteri]|nr:hypothetical protein [Calothrix elsteri]
MTSKGSAPRLRRSRVGKETRFLGLSLRLEIFHGGETGFMKSLRSH